MKTLETERLLLREWRLSDSRDMFEYACNELVGPPAGWKPHRNQEETKNIIKMFIDAGDVYAIELKEEGKVIGSLGVHNNTPDKSLKHLKQREVGFVLNPTYWGKGYVPEAVKKVLKHGFEELEIDIFWCAHADFNENSKRVIEKCGFKEQFKKKETRPMLDNEEVNSIFYNVSKNEYLKRTKEGTL